MRLVLRRFLGPLSVQNRVIIDLMNRIGMIKPLGSEADAAARVRSGGAFHATIGLVLLAGLALFVLLALRAPEPIGITILAGLACLGIFFLFGIAARLIRIGGVGQSVELYESLFNGLQEGVLLTEPDGRPIFANHAYQQIVGCNALGDVNSMELLFADVPACSEAFFRLARASERGRRHVEEVNLPSWPGREGPVAFRISVEPAADRLQPEGSPLPILWQILDLTELRRAEARRMQATQAQIARYEQLGLGVFVFGRDGQITYLNTQLRRWLHHSSGDAHKTLQLADVVAEDGLALLQSLFDRKDLRGERIDLDLIREDGIRWPASITLSREGEMLAVGVLERLSDALGPPNSSAPLRFAKFFQAAPFGIALVGADGVIQSANAAFGRLLQIGGSVRGSNAMDVLGKGCHRDSHDSIQQALHAALAGKANIPPFDLTAGVGQQFTRQVFMTSVGRGRNSKGGVMLYVIDATEQKSLELKYAQSQKLEAVGKLAGGIAHDFNNVLTVIIGFSDLLLGTHRPSDPAYKNISSIRSSANRAARMVKQLLAFSRRQTLQPEVLAVGECLTDISVLLARLLGEQIELDIIPGRKLWQVKADRTQLEQVLFNLAANARDAMPDGGKLVIKTRNISERESRKLEAKGLARGQYVAIEVADSGTGMSPEVLGQIFEPFFTTKDVGKGTGLGLSTVYGIVKQTGGYIFADSEVGRGTTFRIYLPRHLSTEDDELETPQASGLQAMQGDGKDLTGAGKVLIVEDEDGVRMFAVQALKRKGYDVVEACDGVEALDILKEAKFQFDIVVSDVKMPEMDGPTLLTEVRKHRPDLKFIFVSGYADDAFANNLDPDADFSFLPKPYTLAQIAAEVKNRLG